LAEIVSTQDAKLLASVGRARPLKALAVSASAGETSPSAANTASAAALLRSAGFYASYLVLGFGLLVLVVALAFATLAAAAKVGLVLGCRHLRCTLSSHLGDTWQGI
jgi:hypothetical protein